MRWYDKQKNIKIYRKISIFPQFAEIKIMQKMLCYHKFKAFDGRISMA